MSLRDWAESGWLRSHKTTKDEIGGLFGIVERDLADARRDISADWRFGIAYNAALRLCTILLYEERKLESGTSPGRDVVGDGAASLRTAALLPPKVSGHLRFHRQMLSWDQRRR